MTKRRALLAIVALVWLVALIAGFYVGHKPFSAQVALAVAHTALDLLAVSLLVALGGALGSFVVSSKSADFSPTETLALQALLGLDALSLAVFALLALSLMPPAWLAWLLTLAALLILRRRVSSWLRGLRDAMRGPLPQGRWTRFLAVSVLALLGMALVAALAPPNKWDALVYHLVAPADYLRAGRFLSGAENHFYGFPQLVEMLHVWLMRLRGPSGTAAAPLHFAFGGLLLMLLTGLARRVTGGNRVGWLAAIVLLVADSFWGEFAWPYVDLAAAAYVLAAFIVIARRDAVQRGWLVAGLLAGFALSTKYTLAGPAIGLGLLVIATRREAGPAVALADAARFTAVALAVLSPWLVKNALLDANPISPLIFPTEHFDALDQRYYLRPGTGLPLWQLAAAPVHAAVVGREGGAPYGASTGALLVAMLPAVLVGWRIRPGGERALVRHALLVAAPAYALWLLGNGVSWFLVQTRLLFPVFPLLAMVGALGLEGLRRVKQPLDVGWLARTLVGLVVALALVAGVLSFVAGGAARIVLGLRSPDNYLSERLGWYYPMTQEMNGLPPGSRVLFLWEPRTFYCEAVCVPDSLINRWWHDRQLEPDPLAIAQAWREAGYTHVLVHESGFHFLVEEEPYELLDAADVAAFDQLRDEALDVVWQGSDVYTLYAWRDGPG